MLSDFFLDLEIDEKAPVELAFCAPDDFKPLDHRSRWFLDESSSESLCHKAFYAYHIGDYDRSFEYFKGLLNKGGHNRVHVVSIYESIIRSALKTSKCTQDVLQSLLNDYKNVATEYGDQLQYWNTAALVYQKVPGYEVEYLKTVALLCLSVDSPEHWLLFGQCPSFQSGPNFEIAFLTRAVALIDCNIEFAFGFVAELLKKQKCDLDMRIEQLHLPRETIKLARVKMVTDLLSSGKLRELGDDVKRPVHDCRSKVGVFKKDSDIPALINEFISRFDWMFEAMSFH